MTKAGRDRRKDSRQQRKLHKAHANCNNAHSFWNCPHTAKIFQSPPYEPLFIPWREPAPGFRLIDMKYAKPIL